MADITMPQLGETVTEGTIIKWLKKVGDKVAEDEMLFEVSTDKVDSEVPSSVAGYLTEVLVGEGETVDVGTKVAVVGDQPPSEAEAEGDADEAEAAGGDGATAEKTEAADEAKAEPAKAEPEKAEPAQPAAASEQDGQSDGSSPAPEPQPAKGSASGSSRRGGGQLLSPVVRKLLSEHDLDPSQIDGTGQGGRITRSDVLAYIDKDAAAKPAPEPEPAAAQAKPAAPAAAEPEAPAEEKPAKEAPAPGADREVVAFSNIRRRTAEHMMRSVSTSAHVLTVAEVDFEGVERVRKQHREGFKAKEGFSLTYLPFVARAVIDAIAEFPIVNASVGDNELILHRRVHLGLAVDLGFEGLIVPVIRDADSQRLRALARAGADLARRARSRELTADDISGGTFTITNPGPFGTFLTAPIINQPQVAILSTDGVKKRPVAVELPGGGDAIVVHPVGNLALSFDHRAFDGAYAAAFLGRCREILETRDWSAEL